MHLQEMQLDCPAQPPALWKLRGHVWGERGREAEIM
jgi:hypothetical protein